MNIQERSQIRTIIQSPQWKTIEAVANQLKQAWMEENQLRETVEETAMNVAKQQGRIEGINHFIQELYKQSQSDA